MRTVPAAVGARAPHVEDRRSRGLTTTRRWIQEGDLVKALREAETATSPEELFQCQLQSDNPRGNAWVKPEGAVRSIAGCGYESIYFTIYLNRSNPTLRARMKLPFGYCFASLPVVDREWNWFLEWALNTLDPLGGASATQDFFNRTVSRILPKSEYRFARLGLARADQYGKCWLMLDSLFPQPQGSWIRDHRPGLS